MNDEDHVNVSETNVEDSKICSQPSELCKKDSVELSENINIEKSR